MRSELGKRDREAENYTEEEGDIDALEERFVRGGGFRDVRGHGSSLGL